MSPSLRNLPLGHGGSVVHVLLGGGRRLAASGALFPVFPRDNGGGQQDRCREKA